MRDGERVTVRGSSGTYVLSRAGDVYACTCPAWTKQRAAPAERTCKHLRAHLGEAHEAGRVAGGKVAAAQARARRSALQAPRSSREVRRLREAALVSALERFPAAAARMQAVYGMRLPRCVAYGAAFWLGLSREERQEAWAYLGNGLAGIGEWFEPGGLERAPLLDERLHYRYYCDPPEFVTLCTGNSDGGHWGLWYDDPRELPRLIAFNWARDDAVCYPRAPTLLAALRQNMTGEPLPEEEWPHARGVLAWLDELHVLELAAHAEERIGPPPARTGWCIAGIDPVVEGARLPADLEGYPAQQARHAAYREAPERALEWLAQARRELAAGQPLRALFLGRELHWSDPDALREAGRDLLIAAYEATGRHAHAETLRVHHAHRDLRSVAIYGEIPAPPLVEAARAGELARVQAMLAAGPVEAGEAAAALLAAHAVPLFELLLPHAPAAVDAKLASVLADIGELTHMELPVDPLAEQVAWLLAHGAAAEPALAGALAARLGPQALELAGRVDPRHVDAEGRTPLHHAAQAGAVEVARRLVERGADPRVRDAQKETPIDLARALWQDAREASHALLELFKGAERALAQQEASAAAQRADRPIEVGDAVVHARFGVGSVTAREGAGEAAKLTIAFPDAARTLLARFVRRA